MFGGKLDMRLSPGRLSAVLMPNCSETESGSGHLWAGPHSLKRQFQPLEKIVSQVQPVGQFLFDAS